MVRTRLSVLSALTVGFLVAVGGNAHADSTTAQTVSTGLLTTDFTAPLTFAKFDTSLGTLNSVTVSLFGTVNGTQRFESTDSKATTITTTTSALLTVSGPSGDLLNVTPSASRRTSATAYDGVTDYAGTSGATYTNVTATSDVVTITTSNGIASFAGPGSITLDVLAEGTSLGRGSGNLFTQFSTDASATVSVVYNYTKFSSSAAAPEPGSLAFLGTGILGIAGTVIRRRAK